MSVFALVLPPAADGPLHKLFSNIKLAPGVTPHQSGPQQPPQQPQPSIPLPPRNQIPRPQRSSAPAQRQPPAPAPQRPSAPAAENGIQQQQQPAAAARSGSGSLPKPASPTSPAPAALGGGPANSGTSGTPSGKAGPPARPPLLTPSFFKQPAPQSEQHPCAGPASTRMFTFAATQPSLRSSMQLSMLLLPLFCRLRHTRPRRCRRGLSIEPAAFLFRRRLVFAAADARQRRRRRGRIT